MNPLLHSISQQTDKLALGDCGKEKSSFREAEMPDIFLKSWSKLKWSQLAQSMSEFRFNYLKRCFVFSLLTQNGVFICYSLAKPKHKGGKV